MMSTTRREPGSRTNENQQGYYSHISFHSQRQKILIWLQHNHLTTLQARQELDIMHPAARVMELRELGNNIVTIWTKQDGHRIAKYVLLASEVKS